ncbi:hypothetical protein B9Z55_028454 [Caenorhabditis nigoni]|uniref:Uncharacterized protein n=1 Tax=Caenorhabditis nigoni TaxID=1611254 RepID=A0A2G5SC12_9PELO|nr:hypothetical protein B9Z55_028454 [Caenorhabditis nigoni]
MPSQLHARSVKSGCVKSGTTRHHVQYINGRAKEKESKLWAEIREIDKQRNPRPGKVSRSDKCIFLIFLKFRRPIEGLSQLRVRFWKGDTPIRPFTEELLWNDGNVSGTAAQIFEMVYPNRILAGHIPWKDGNFSAPANHCYLIEQTHQDKLRMYRGVPEEVKKRKKFKEYWRMFKKYCGLSTTTGSMRV